MVGGVWEEPGIGTTLFIISLHLIRDDTVAAVVRDVRDDPWHKLLNHLRMELSVKTIAVIKRYI